MRPNLGLQYDLLAVEQPHRVAAFLELQAPGRADGNWTWRFCDKMLTPGIEDRLRELTESTGRAS